jgi:hypothetical protein
MERKSDREILVNLAAVATAQLLRPHFAKISLLGVDHRPPISPSILEETTHQDISSKRRPNTVVGGIATCGYRH